MQGKIRAGVIGWPVAHSRSPALHGYWLKKYDINGSYELLPVEPGRFDEEIARLANHGYAGVNVTVPYKQLALEGATTYSARAQRIGAANTLTFLPGFGYHADNTDGIGFSNNLKQGAQSWNASAGPALVLGAGGAARAVVSAMLDEGAPHVILCNRTRAKAKSIQSDFGDRVVVKDWESRAEYLGNIATLINTTSLGMIGSSPLEMSLTGLSKKALVTDIVYTPLNTELLKNAAALGCITVDGLGMLLHQAAPGFEAWFGTAPKVDQELRQAVLNV